MRFNFHIIYTPGTFGRLSLALESLLSNTDFRLTLVSNGLPKEEFGELRAYSLKNKNRLSCIDLPGANPISHGWALTHLFNTSSDDFFCFMDSDIFAVKKFNSEKLDSLLQSCDVLVSCKPIEWTTKESPRGYRGHSTMSPSGEPLGMTYWAIYKRGPVLQILNTHNLTFERYDRASQIPANVKKRLKPEDRHSWKFNTGKLLNLIQSYEGQKIRHEEFEEFLHLGGVSRFSENRQKARPSLDQKPKVAQDRIKMRQYFYSLLKLLNEENHITPTPDLHLHDKTLQEAVRNATTTLQSLNKSLTKNEK